MVVHRGLPVPIAKKKELQPIQIIFLSKEILWNYDIHILYWLTFILLSLFLIPTSSGNFECIRLSIGQEKDVKQIILNNQMVVGTYDQYTLKSSVKFYRKDDIDLYTKCSHIVWLYEAINRPGLKSNTNIYCKVS